MRRRQCAIVAVILMVTLLFITLNFTRPTSKNRPGTVTKFPRHVENLPDIYFTTEEIQINTSCGQFPQLADIHFTNNHWQSQRTQSGTFQLFRAYLDTRFNTTSIRIVAMLNNIEPKTTYYCQVWFNDWSQQIVDTGPLIYGFNPQWDGADNSSLYQPYIVTCPLDQDKDMGDPMSVSLVEERCDQASNNLAVIRNVGPKRDFVVCVKGLNYPYEDKSASLAEWIELNRLLGAQKIQFYKFHVHHNVDTLLRFYQSEGLVEVTPITVLGPVSNHPYLEDQYLKVRVTERRLQEVITFNDCLYKHLDQFRYLVVVDIDEVIVPVSGTWSQLLPLGTTNITSYMARNVYFFDSFRRPDDDWLPGVPRYMHMLQHVFRTNEHSPFGYYGKGFHRTDSVMAQHNHYPIMCYQGCHDYHFDTDVVQMQHYRSDCVDEVKNCDELKRERVRDEGVLRFKTELVGRVKGVLEKLGLVAES